jgi:hypothetical protein
MKTLLLLSAFSATLALAQNPSEAVKPGQGAKLAVPSVPGAKPKAQKPKGAGGPTVITSREASFRNSTQTAEFKFEVTVDGPAFKISCDQLKIIMKPKTPSASPGQEQPAAEQGAGGAANLDGALGGNIEEAIATGNVIITQDKPGKPGEPPSRYLAKGKRAVFNSAKGSLTITGWPQIIESVDGKPSKQTNALEETTKVILFQSNDMEIEGRSEVILHGKQP